MSGFSLTGHRYAICMHEYCAVLGDKVPQSLGIEDAKELRLHKARYAQFCPVICPYHPGRGCDH